MEKKQSPDLRSKSKNSPSGANYAYKPLYFGKLVKEKARLKQMSNQEVADYLEMNVRSIPRYFRKKTPTLDDLFQCSEMLQEDLLLEYHPNVKPLPNPLQEENDRLRSYVKDDETYKGKYEALQKKVIVLEGQIELLERMVKEKG